MDNKKKIGNLDFIFECEQCTESWSENLLDLIDRCGIEELQCLQNYIQKKINFYSEFEHKK
ncbi:MAG: hypothetical protein ACFFCV_10580 [Promethearchaeota archaeon]